MGSLTDAEIKEGNYGYVTTSEVNGKLNVIFENPAALEDATIPFETNMDVLPETYKALGYSWITVKAGTYTVDFSRFPKFGEVNLDIIAK